MFTTNTRNGWWCLPSIPCLPCAGWKQGILQSQLVAASSHVQNPKIILDNQQSIYTKLSKSQRVNQTRHSWDWVSVGPLLSISVARVDPGDFKCLQQTLGMGDGVCLPFLAFHVLVESRASCNHSLWQLALMYRIPRSSLTTNKAFIRSYQKISASIRQGTVGIGCQLAHYWAFLWHMSTLVIPLFLPQAQDHL